MKLDELDIQAVARDRVNRIYRKKMLYVTILSILAMGAGYFFGRTYSTIGWVLAIGGFILYYWYTEAVNKKIKKAKIQLLREWQMEGKSENSNTQPV